MTDNEEDFRERLTRIVADITLGMDCSVVIGHEQAWDIDGADMSRYFFQIQCWRRDVMTGEMGLGYGGKAYLSPHGTDSELIQIAERERDASLRREVLEQLRLLGTPRAKEYLQKVGQNR